jgi:hypothetical protein
MKVAVISFSGNVGKTTISAHLLKPRMGEAPVFSVESLNVDAAADGLEVERLRGKKFGELQEQLMTLDSAIVDVGASNVEEFLKLMQQYAGSHEEFDYFLVPVVKERKQQADTVNTIRALASIGVPRMKIRTVFNKVEVDESVDDEFAAIFGLAEVERQFVLNPQAVVYANEVFERLKTVKRSLGDVTADPIDYRARLRETQDDDERDLCVRMVALKRLAVTANKNLDDAFRAVFA